MAEGRYDLVVIGGGSAGLIAADFAARIGATVLIAAEQLGGDCTWTGCIPSKALIRAARLARDGRQIKQGAPVDFARVMGGVRSAIARVYAYETPAALAERGIDVTLGAVRFLDRGTVEAGSLRISGDHFVICTGAEPMVPSIPGLERVRYLTYKTVFDLERLPGSLVIVGAGATGVEFAQAFARLGSRVTLFEQRPSVLSDADPDARAIIHRRLEEEGVAVRVSTVATGMGDAETVLLATGRRPRVDGLNLEAAGVEVEKGAIRVDKNLRTTNPLVYAAGDVTGGFQFTHYAGWQGYVAARNALLPGAQEGIRQNIPWAVFTDPEVAQVGISEMEARSQFSDAKVHRLDLERVDRAQTEDEDDGFLKLITHAGGRLVGATVVSRAASETINELSLAIDRGLTLSDLASTIHAYPTFGFAVQQLAADATLEAASSGIRGKAVRALRRLS